MFRRNFPFKACIKSSLLVFIIYILIPCCVAFTRIILYWLFNIDNVQITRCLSAAFLSGFIAVFFNSITKTRTQFRLKGMAFSIMYLLPFIGLSFTAIISVTALDGITGLLPFLLPAASAAIYEEVLFRYVPRTYLLHTCHCGTHTFPLICFFSALTFGLCHIVNISSGNLLGTILQVLYAFCMGFMLMAVSLRSGSVAGGMICHFLNNLIAYTQKQDPSVSGETVYWGSSRFFLPIGMMLFYLIYGILLLYRRRSPQTEKLVP